MTEPFVLGLVTVTVTLGLAQWVWRRQRARDIADAWLRQHNYRVRDLTHVIWQGAPRFRATAFRNNDWAVDFRAVVDDLRLGGTGEVRLRVWTDLLGQIDREPEVSWVKMPTMDGGGAPTPEMRWETRQRDLLRIIADAGPRLRPVADDDAARAEFDEMVEHVLALQRRGLVHCSTPIAEMRRNGLYAEMTDVVLTEEGRRVLAASSASPPRTASAAEGRGPNDRPPRGRA